MDSVSKIFTNFNLYDNHMKLSFLKVNAESPPKAVHLWHANTFWNNRRDFRIASLDKPCLTGPVVSIAGYDNLCSNLYVIWTAEVHMFYLLITLGAQYGNTDCGDFKRGIQN